MMSHGKTLKKIQHVIEYLFVRTFYHFVRLVPKKLRAKFANGLAAIARLGTKRRVEVARKNLNLVFSESTPEEIDSVVKGVYRNLANNFCDLADACHAFSRVDVTPEAKSRMEDVAKIVASGQPVIFATGHMGNWEILGQYVGHCFFRETHFVAQEQSNKLVDKFVNGLRVPRNREELIVHSGQAARTLPRLLKRGVPIFLVADQDAGSEGIVVDFMGTPASYHRGIASFSYHFNAPLVMVFLIRKGDRMKMVVPAIVKPNRDADREQEIRRLLSVYSKELGDLVSRYPDQWLWTHRRWKSTVGKY